jgi:hypothetical protein
MLLGSFILRVVTPLDFAHFNDLITGYSLCRMCCQPKPTNGRRQATQEPGGPEPLSVGPAARTCPEVEVRWACHLTYTWLGRYLMCFS